MHPEDERFRHLIGKRAVLPLCDRTIPIIGDAILVSMEFGTGAVKVTPGHDFSDFETGVRHGLEQISVFDLKGFLNENAPERFRGLTIADGRTAVLAALQEEGLLIDEKPHKLAIGRCQRCGTIIEPMLSLQWFVKTEELAKPAIAAVEQGKTKFVPEHWTDDYYRWMRNIRDWCISRQLWWGHRIPAWYVPEGAGEGAGKVFVARTFEEACAQAGRTDLVQDDDVLDTWFSSALWPFSTLGWPDQTRDLKTFYPTAVMETGHDILFFWVARMMMFGPALYEEGAVSDRDAARAWSSMKTARRCPRSRATSSTRCSLVHGAAMPEILGFDKTKVPAKKELDEALNKFKKAFPSAAVAYPNGFPRQGADALRFFLLVMGAQGRNIRLSVPRIDGYRHFLNKIWSATRFFLMNVDDNEFEPLQGFREALLHSRGVGDSEPQPSSIPIELGLADRYILSRLQAVTDEVDTAFNASKFSDGAQALYRFFWTELCDWYIELCKPHLQATAEPQKRRAALGTLSIVLETSLRLLHPIIPFISEELWLKLPRPWGSPQSIMITLYPTADAVLRDPEAERQMTLLQEAVGAMRTIKSTYNLKAQSRAEGEAEAAGAAKAAEVGEPAAPSDAPTEAPARLQFLIKATDPAVREVLLAQRPLIELLTRAQLVDVVEDVASDDLKGTLAQIAPGLVVLLLHADTLIDVPAELSRLQKEAAKVDKDLQTLRGRLQNADFVARAKPEIVEQNRARVIELEQRLGELSQHQQTIASMA